jgi:HlyD family secretion protein
VVDVDNADMKLRPGMTASSTVVYAETRDVLAIPNTALRFHPPPEISDPVPSSSGRRHAHGHGGAADGGVPHEHGDWRARRAAAGSGSGSGSDTSEGEGRDAREAKDGKVLWIESGERLTPVTVHTGLTDGTVTELTDDTLPEGSVVVIDATSTTKPSIPALGGGGGGGGGAGGRRSMF